MRAIPNHNRNHSDKRFVFEVNLNHLKWFEDYLRVKPCGLFFSVVNEPIGEPTSLSGVHDFGVLVVFGDPPVSLIA